METNVATATEAYLETFEEFDRDEPDPSCDSNKSTYHCAKREGGGRKCLPEQDQVIPRPHVPGDISEQHMRIPDEVYNLLAWISSDNTSLPMPGRVHAHPRIHRLVMSMGQDLLYNTSNGCTKTPKHVVLTVSIKSCHIPKSIWLRCLVLETL